MELGLSLGDASKSLEFPKEKDTTLNQQKQPNSKGGDLGFSLGLSTSCAVLEKAKNKSQENDEDIEDDDGDDDDDDETSGDDHGGSDDQNHGGESGAPMQLSLLPLVPVPRKVSSSSHVQSLPWSSDNGLCEGSSRDGSSGNIGRPATRGLDVNRLPVAVAEEVSSANSVGPPFGMYPNTNWLGGGSNKRDHRHLNDDVAEAERASSRASDEDENGPNARKKLRLSKDQSAFLEESFKEHSTLNPKQKHALAKQLNLRPRQVEVWFQNRRARTKLKQTEVDCEYLKRCCETLTEENRRLHKELQELRALKTTSSPFYMQLPATTLTMCPSCERVATSSTAPTPPASISNTAITIASTAATTAPANPTAVDAKATPFPLTRPRFFPFPQTPTHPNQPAAS